MHYYYKVLWYEDRSNKPRIREFETKEEAMKFFDSIKNIRGNHNFCITKRDRDDENDFIKEFIIDSINKGE